MTNTTLRVAVSRIELPLTAPFRIARGEVTHAKTVLVRLISGECEGLGEAAPIARYDESCESVVTYFETHSLATDDPFKLEALLHEGIPPAARAGLDLAAHDLIGKLLGAPVHAMLGLDPARAPATSMTVGIDDAETTRSRVLELRDVPAIKVKLGTGSAASQIERVRLIRECFGGRIAIDANEGWDAGVAIKILSEIERDGIEFCEQPIPAGQPEQLRTIRESVRIPIVADEDALDAADLPRLYGCIDGVNVKLAKAGGIRGALAMIHTARAMGMKVLLGCMLESTIAATGAAQIAPLADWVDIDAPTLIADEPFTGLTYDRGRLILPTTPGLGVREARSVA